MRGYQLYGHTKRSIQHDNGQLADATDIHSSVVDYKNKLYFIKISLDLF